MIRKAPAVTAVVFLAAIVALTWFLTGGSRFTLARLAAEAVHPRMMLLAVVSLGYVALAAGIAAELSRGRVRGALAVGWVAALPGLLFVLTLAVEATGLDALLDEGGPGAPVTLGGRLLDFARGFTLFIGWTLPFSAGPLLFGLGFPIAMAARGVLRLARMTRA